MKSTLLLLALILLSSSCATVINGRRTNVNVRTSRTTNLVIEGDTVLRDSNQTVLLRVENDRDPLRITTFDSLGTKPLFIRSKTSPTYWLNAVTIPVFATGFLFDELTGQKWKYPRNIYIDVDGDNNSYLPYFPMDSSLLARKNKLTFAPLSIIHEYHPAFEFGYERIHGEHWGTQISLGVFRSWPTEYARNSKGVKISLEEKYFFRNENNTRYYVGFALEHHHKSHESDMSFINLDAQGFPIWEAGTFTQRVTVQKRFFGFTPRIGFQTYLRPRLVAEGFFGVGLRYRRVRHPDVSPNVQLNSEFGEWWDIQYDSNSPGNNTTLNWDLNFRLAWTF
jgi:hypothetical protein